MKRGIVAARDIPEAQAVTLALREGGHRGARERCPAAAERRLVVDRERRGPVLHQGTWLGLGLGLGSGSVVRVRVRVRVRVSQGTCSAPLEPVELAAFDGRRQAIDHLDGEALDLNPAVCEAIVSFHAVHVGACHGDGRPKALVDIAHVGAGLRDGGVVDGAHVDADRRAVRAGVAILDSPRQRRVHPSLLAGWGRSVQGEARLCGIRAAPFRPTRRELVCGWLKVEGGTRDSDLIGRFELRVTGVVRVECPPLGGVEEGGVHVEGSGTLGWTPCPNRSRSWQSLRRAGSSRPPERPRRYRVQRGRSCRAWLRNWPGPRSRRGAAGTWPVAAPPPRSAGCWTCRRSRRGACDRCPRWRSARSSSSCRWGGRSQQFSSWQTECPF
eukprot:scaffold104738_cov67-Phaeocystis_antarctica.AAC.2